MKVCFKKLSSTRVDIGIAVAFALRLGGLALNLQGFMAKFPAYFH